MEFRWLEVLEARPDLGPFMSSPTKVLQFRERLYKDLGNPEWYWGEWQTIPTYTIAQQKADGVEVQEICSEQAQALRDEHQRQIATQQPVVIQHYSEDTSEDKSSIELHAERSKNNAKEALGEKPEGPENDEFQGKPL